MFKKMESLAWLILVVAFISCIGLAIAVPLSVRWYAINSMRPLNIRLQPRGGDVRYQPSGSSAMLVVDGATNVAVSPRTRISLDQEGDAQLLFYHPEDPEAPIATVTLYGTTDIVIGSARTPRFGFSPLPHTVRLRADEAINMQASVAGNGREAKLSLQTPQGPVDMGEGTFSLVVDPTATDVFVSDGRAQVFDPATGERPLVVSLQRTQITHDGLGEIYVGARNVLRNRNGDFEQPLDDYWETFADAFEGEEPAGLIRRQRVGDEYMILISRHGQGWAETGMRQEINQDIRGISSLRVRAKVKVDTQTLPVCGSLGTECPLMIRLKYLDAATGGEREWLQGFYTLGGDNQPYCQVCSDWRAEHIQIPQNIWYDYESLDLLPQLRTRGFQPATLLSIQVDGSGHVYGSAVDEVAILVGE